MTPPLSAPPLPFVGIDWGTTNRRAWVIAPDGTCLAEREDDQGVLAVGGQFAASLRTLLARFDALPADAPVLMSGAVGSTLGWQVAPYVDASVPFESLGRHAVPLEGGLDGRRCALIPGYRWDSDGQVDVMRGEETQLLGVVAGGLRDGWFVLPGTHSKWVKLRDGRLAALHTYLTGELYATLTTRGTLAAGPDTHPSPAAFLAGVDAARGQALSHALFGCRARMVTGQMPAAHAASYLSGVLIGAEWHDRKPRDADDGPVHVIGSPRLAEAHAAAAHWVGRTVVALDPHAIHLAALRHLLPSLTGLLP